MATDHYHMTISRAHVSSHRGDVIYLEAVHWPANCFTRSRSMFNLILSSYNPGKKSLGQYFDLYIVLSFVGSLLKQCMLFEIFLQFSLPHPVLSLSSEKILDTHVLHCLRGEGKGWTCVNWKTPQKGKERPQSVPRLLSMILVWGAQLIMHTCWTSMLWQLSKEGIRRPVSLERILGSGVDQSKSSIFLKLSADKLLVFKWSQAQV